MVKQYVGLIRDHSASMGHLGSDALKDYNENITALKSASFTNHIDTIATVIKCGCGHQGAIEREVTNQKIEYVYPISKYATDGYSTPLFDSVGQMIEIMSATNDPDPTVSFLIVATTDGENNRTYSWSANRLADEIKRLQGTDRWTFVFRVPYGYKDRLVRLLGVHPGNVLEWEQTSLGIERSMHQTISGYNTYYAGTQSAAAAGRSYAASSFYVDPNVVTTQDLKINLVDISSKVETLSVWPQDSGRAIKEFVETVTKKPYILGNAYYQLTKAETFQPQKDMIVFDTKKRHMYHGQSAARQLLGLPSAGSIKIIPAGIGDKKVFVQSTSVNRKLVGDTLVLVYNK